MISDTEIVVIGGGIAGATASYYLSQESETLLVEKEALGAGASGIAAGMVNPFMSQRAAPMWRFMEILDALDALIRETESENCIIQRGILRITQSQEQIRYFQRAAHDFTAHCNWIEPTTLEAQFPYLNAPFGGLWTVSGFAIDAKRFTAQIVAKALQNHTLQYIQGNFERWEITQNGVKTFLKDGTEIRSKKLILCLGWGYFEQEMLNTLRLHGVKGQIVVLENTLKHLEMPLISGKGYAVPLSNHLILGSNYEHHFTDLNPSPSVSARIISQMAHNFLAIADLKLLQEKAAVRVDVPQIRMPMVGALTQDKRVWIHTGFGSKGLMLAPLLSRDLPQYLANPAYVPAEIQVRYK